MNDKQIDSKKFDSMLQAILEQMKLEQFNIIGTIHQTTDGEEEKEYGINRLVSK